MLNKQWMPLNWRTVFIYLSALLFAVLAGLLEIRVRDQLDEMSYHLRLSLKFRAIVIVESMESYVELQQAAFEEGQSVTFQAKAQRYFGQMRLDQDKAQTFKEEAEHYEQLAEEDQAQADALSDKIRQDETLRVELLNNISIEQQREDDLADELQHIHKGLCNTRVVGWFCDVVGGAVELKRQADQEAIQIQHDTAYLEQTSRREFMEKIVEASLQGNATEYKKIGSELFQTAQYWDSLAQKDYMMGFENISEKLHSRGEMEREYNRSNLIHSEKEIETAVGLYKNAVLLATAAAASAMFALGFFATRVVSQLADIARSCNLGDGDDRWRTTDLEFWRLVCAALLHIGIFFVSIGLCGDFVTQIEHYEWRERTAIITWFAFVAGMIRTLIMQTIPHIMADWPLHRRDVLLVVKYSLLRLLASMFLFGMELLTVYTSFPALVSSNMAVIFGHPAVVLVGVTMAYLYVYVFEPRESNDTSLCMASTLTLEEVSCAASEETPLTTVDEDYCKYSITRTESTAVALLAMDLGERGREVSIAPSSDYYSLDSMSPYFVRLDVELSNLKLHFELLVVATLARVMTDSLLLLYKNSPERVIVSLSLSLVTFIAVAAGFCWAGLIGKRGSSRKAYDDDRHVEVVSL